jgi:hypothetical protein
MTIKYKIMILVSAVAIGLSSCIGISTTKSLQNSPLNADFRFQMQWSDLEYVGEVKATANWTQYLGLLKVSNYTSNITYTFEGGKTFLGGGLLGNGKTDMLVKRALYDAIEKDPALQEADFIIPVQTKTETTRMFLGAKKVQTVKAKLYKLKENK